MANIVAALDAGATFIEGSICGIGGGIMTPTTMGAVGNLATEDIVHLLNEMNVATGIATEDAVAAAWDVARLLDITPRSHVASGGTRAQNHERRAGARPVASCVGGAWRRSDARARDPSRRMRGSRDRALEVAVRRGRAARVDRRPRAQGGRSIE